MKKIIAKIVVLALVVFCFSGCTKAPASDLAYLKEKGIMKIGITEYAPMDYRDESGQWIGFDAELARLVAQKLDLDVEFLILSDWAQKYYELECRNIDAIWNGMTITEETLLNTSCTDPYVINAQVVVMKADQISQYPEKTDLCSLKFAVESGSAGEALLKGLAPAELIALQDQTSALMEVAAGTADACVVDLTLANAMTGEGTAYKDLAIGLSLSEESYGIGFRKNSDVTEQVNRILGELRRDGSLQALAEKYGLTLAG